MAPNRFHRKGPRSKRKAVFSFSSRFRNRSNLAFTHVATCHQTILAINPKPFCLHISYSSFIKTSTESTLQLLSPETSKSQILSSMATSAAVARNLLRNSKSLPQILRGQILGREYGFEAGGSLLLPPL
ncbi:zinc finger protein 27-like protein [Corchorus olitorius]|uniref:Zinc finger protein 27-like protein n=1 Tax=Corchorus olitorius TaxID=93759 RepID=A0A1R3KCC9_9ROSI|nr:zinc finger protein 27-like protein [Corchorus olitorius]